MITVRAYPLWMKTALFVLLPLFGMSQVQCVVDIQIIEAPTIDMCEGNLQTISGINGFQTYDWTGPETVSGQTITPNFSGQYVLSSLDFDGCTSTDTIDVTIHPNPLPAVISSEGNPLCPGTTGTTLSTPTNYSSYLWSGGSTSPTLQVTTPGTYNLTVVDQNGCTGLSSISLGQYNFQVNPQGNSACEGGTTTLVASGGSTYSWSTGETGSTIVVSPSSSTVYTVTISEGSCTETLSYTIEPANIPQFNLEDTVYVAPGQAYFISGPPGYNTYNWQPTTQISAPSLQGVTFAGDTTQWIYIQATHPNGCVFDDSVLVVVVDFTIPNGFSPNNDGKNDYWIVPELYNYPADVTIWNRWGDPVLKASPYMNNWNGRCHEAACLGNDDLPDGTYFYLLDVQGVIFKGYITLKR